MVYLGSKRRIAKEILQIMLTHRKPGQWWVEPFVGGGNVICLVDGPRLGADANADAIKALILIRDHVDSLPRSARDFTEADYQTIRADKYNAIRPFVGFAYSYGGKWFRGFSRNKKKGDFVQHAFNSAMRQSPGLRGMHLCVSDYQQLEIPPNSLIYCDPPYQETEGYRTKIDHAAFWQWAREKAWEGHTVFVSEYQAPSDFRCVWEGEIRSHLSEDRRVSKERLFMYGGPCTDMQFEYPSNATVLVTGSRTYQDRDRVLWELERLELRGGRLVVGCAPGADTLALHWARTRPIFRSFIRYEAQWDTLGRAAGPTRNRRMVDVEKPDIVLAFFDGVITRGTLHCLTYAMSRGARPRIVGLPLTLLSG